MDVIRNESVKTAGRTAGNFFEYFCRYCYIWSRVASPLIAYSVSVFVSSTLPDLFPFSSKSVLTFFVTPKKNKTSARIILIKVKRTFGNQEEPQRVIRMLLDMSLPFLNEIRMRRSMEHILQSIGMHWMRKKYHSCR